MTSKYGEIKTSAIHAFGNLLQCLLLPIAMCYLFLTRIRNWLFDNRLIGRVAVNCPVVSIGNLTVGGTGKTPFVDWLITKLSPKQIRIAVVMRGYRGNFHGTCRVDPNVTNAAKVFGDEAVWLACRQPQVTVYVGQSKSEACRLIAEKVAPDIIIVDDGFQHRRLVRDLDIVLIDATVANNHYRPLPWGRAREPWCALKRANIFCLTKVNIASAANIAWLNKKIGDLQLQVPVLHFAYKLLHLRHLRTSHIKLLEEFQHRPCLAVCGIGSPAGFISMLRQANIDLVGHQIFPDHHDYTENDWAAILKNAQKNSANWICITAKDAVKLVGFSQTTPDIEVWVAEAQCEQLAADEILDAKFNALFL